MIVNIELKGIEEIRERLSKIDVDAQLQQAISQTAAELKEDMRKPLQRKRPAFPKGTGELRPSVNYPYGIPATDRAWKSIQLIQGADELFFEYLHRAIENETR